MHIISDPSMKRHGYIYRHAAGGLVGVPMDSQPCINWKHIDGPLLYTSDGQLHWLTWRERLRLSFGFADIHDIDFERRDDQGAAKTREA
jgi:hypothetical protein